MGLSPETMHPTPSSLHRDLDTILAVQALRAFAYGFGSVILGSSLAAGGLSDVEVSLVFAAMLAGTALVSIGLGLAGERLGRRRVYGVLLAVMGLAGAAYSLTDSLPVLILVAMTGTLSTDPNESGPITSLEQAMMGSAPARERARRFGRYNAIAYLAGAVGALAGGGPSAFRRVVPSLPADQRWLLVFPIVAAACVVLAARLSPAVEATVHGRTGRPLARSRGAVTKLASLFGLDAFAGGFVVTTFVVFWFERRFGASAATMGLVVFGAGLLQAASSIASGRLGGRIGLLNTMVFTHLPSNVLLALVPAMPTLGSAIAMLLLRHAISQMDVPARQAYVVTMVDPDERTAAAAFTNTTRYVTRPFGAAAAGAVMQIAIGAPFVVAGGLKIAYDLLLFRTFRRVELPEEAVIPPRPAR